jgi:hypothetical protein
VLLPFGRGVYADVKVVSLKVADDELNLADFKFIKNVSEENCIIFLLEQYTLSDTRVVSETIEGNTPDSCTGCDAQHNNL